MELILASQLSLAHYLQASIFTNNYKYIQVFHFIAISFPNICTCFRYCCRFLYCFRLNTTFTCCFLILYIFHHFYVLTFNIWLHKFYYNSLIYLFIGSKPMCFCVSLSFSIICSRIIYLLCIFS